MAGRKARIKEKHKHGTRKGHFVYLCCRCGKKYSVDEMIDKGTDFSPAFILKLNNRFKVQVGFMWHNIDFICVDCHREVVINDPKAKK